MKKLVALLVLAVSLSFTGIPAVWAADETPTTQKDGDKDQHRHHRHHRRHHHCRHHKHQNQNQNQNGNTKPNS